MDEEQLIKEESNSCSFSNSEMALEAFGVGGEPASDLLDVDRIFADNMMNESSPRKSTTKVSKKTSVVKKQKRVAKEKPQQRPQQLTAGESLSTTKSYWQAKKPDYLKELLRLLETGGIQNVSITATPVSEISRVIEDITNRSPSSGNEETAEERAKRLVKRCCSWILEGKSGAEFNLIQLSGALKETAEACLNELCGFSTQTIDFYRDIIVEVAEKKSYGIKIPKDIQTALTSINSGKPLNLALQDVWEVKEISLLCFNALVDDLEIARKSRRLHCNLLKALEKLIKAIDKGKGEDDAFSAYSKLLAYPLKIKLQTKLVSTKKNAKEDKLNNQTKLSFADNEQLVENFDNLKRVKLDDERKINFKEENVSIPVDTSPKLKKASAVDSSTKNRKKQIRSTDEVPSVKKKLQLTQSEDTDMINETGNSETNRKKDISGESKSLVTKIDPQQKGLEKRGSECKQTKPAAAGSQTTATKNILSFFKRLTPISSAVTPQLNPEDSKCGENSSDQQGKMISQVEENNDNQDYSIPTAVVATIIPIVAEQKSILRRIGSAVPRPLNLQTSSKIDGVIDLKEVLRLIQEESKSQWKYLQQTRKKVEPTKPLRAGQIPQRKRRILVTIHDYVRQYKNVYFDGHSSLITGKNFLKRDEEQVQYDLDTEDELQELNAENIENDNEEDDEDDSVADDESGRHFIVPDGYLSDEGFESDKEDVKSMIAGQKKVNFASFNFADNTSKNGFIHQFNDKSPEVTNFLLGYKIKRFCENEDAEDFPLCVSKASLIKKGKKGCIDGEVVGGVASQNQGTIIWTSQRLKMFSRHIYWSYNSKKQLLETIAKLDSFKDVSKNKLEKKFKEIALKEEKIEGEIARRWLIYPALLESFEIEEKEIEELKKAKLEEYKVTKAVVKKEDKPISSQQCTTGIGAAYMLLPTTQTLNTIGVNIFSKQTRKNKNGSTTPIKSLILNHATKEQIELEVAVKLPAENLKQYLEASIEVQKESSLFLPQQESSNGFRKNSQNSLNFNECSNMSAKRTMKQSTLSFALKKP